MKVEFSREDIKKMERYSSRSDFLTINFNLSDMLGVLDCEADVSVDCSKKEKNAYEKELKKIAAEILRIRKYLCL